jgi:hypothetical protein
MAKDGCVLDGRLAVEMQGSNIMKLWQFAAVGSVLLATTGCRCDPNIPILEREIRLKEDEIYRLRDRLRDLQECPSSEDRPARPSRSNDRERDEGASRRRSSSAAPDDVRPPVLEMPSKPSSEMPDTLKSRSGPLPPDVPDVPENIRGPSKPSGPDMKGPMLQGAPGETSVRPHGVTMVSQAAAAEPFTPSGNSRQVMGIALNRGLTGGINSGEHGGDQGLLVVVEPRDRAGRTVDAPAEMSVVVLDPAQRDEEGMAACAARWDFSAAETAAMFRRAGPNRAIHLMMTWPGEPPKHGKLHLFVRYMTRDGRRLEANQPIEVALAGEKTARWDSAERSERSDETPAALLPEGASYMATRSDASRPGRPAWSPQRQ